MPRRAPVLIAALAAAVLCLSSYEIAAANAPRPSALSATHGIGACATAAGYLRLVDGSAKCVTGYTKVSLAQSATVPDSVSVSISSGSAARTITLPGGNGLTATCTVYSDGVEGRLDVTNSADSNIHLRGTYQSAEQGGSSFWDGYREIGSSTIPDNSPQLINFSTIGTLVGDSNSSSGYYDSHAQFVVFASGATYTVTANWQENGFASCGMDMTVQLSG